MTVAPVTAILNVWSWKMPTPASTMPNMMNSTGTGPTLGPANPSTAAAAVAGRAASRSAAAISERMVSSIAPQVGVRPAAMTGWTRNPALVDRRGCGGRRLDGLHRARRAAGVESEHLQHREERKYIRDSHPVALLQVELRVACLGIHVRQRH